MRGTNTILNWAFPCRVKLLKTRGKKLNGSPRSGRFPWRRNSSGDSTPKPSIPVARAFCELEENDFCAACNSGGSLSGRAAATQFNRFFSARSRSLRRFAVRSSNAKHKGCFESATAMLSPVISGARQESLDLRRGQSPFAHERLGDRFDLRPQQSDFITGHDRQPVKIGAHRLVGPLNLEARSTTCLNQQRHAGRARNAGVCALRFRAGKSHDDIGFRPLASAGRYVTVSELYVGERGRRSAWFPAESSPQSQDHVGIGLAWAAHRAEAVDLAWSRQMITSPWWPGLVGHVFVSAGKVALIAT